MAKLAKKRKRSIADRYSEEAIQKCIQYIESGKKTVYAACKMLNVPMSTVRYRLSSQWKNKTVSGPRSVFSRQEEQKIADWLTGMQERGFPVSRRTMLFKVKDFLTSNPRQTPFKNNRPGRKWFASFMRRNPGFSLRTPEAVSSASARVSEEDIRGWFCSTREWLAKNNMLDVMDHPERVYNGDETSFYLHPKSKEVIARTGSRNVYEVEQAPGKQNITVMFSFSAAGAVVNPHVILPGQRIRKEVVAGFPSDWGLGQSERGWMDKNNFRQYIKKIFHPYLVQQNVEFPVILFVDGHASHKSVEVADLCQSLGIVLISLYPNTTHITQPADVSVFKPLKDEWSRAVEEWRSEHHGEILTLAHFGKVLARTVQQGVKSSSIQNGFRSCGLFPFNPDNVDYSKCLAKKPKSSEDYTVPETVPQDYAAVNCTVTDTCDPVVLPPGRESPNIPYSESPQLVQYNSPVVSVRTSQQYVQIHIDKIIQAVDMIGSRTMNRIQGNVGSLTREERTIRFFFREFVQPYISINNSGETVANDREGDSNRELPRALYDEPTTTDDIFIYSLAEQRDNNENEIVPLENGCEYQENPPIIIELTDHMHEESLIGMENSNNVVYCQLNNAPSDVDGATNEDVNFFYEDQAIMDNEDQFSSHSETHSTAQFNPEPCASLADEQTLQCNEINDLIDSGSTHSPKTISENQSCSGPANTGKKLPLSNADNVLRDTGNKSKPERVRRLSEFLKLPPIPRRAAKHRNYSKQYFPVLTAKERLAEIREKENEKRDMENQKKQRAQEREAMKLKREEIRKAKAEERERKKAEKEQKKEQAKQVSERKRKSKTKVLIR